MKVILVMDTLGAGGAERSMVELAKFLHDTSGVTVKFVCFEHRKIGLEEEVENYGIPTIFYVGEGGYKKRSQFLIKVLKAEAPDLIHSVLVQSNILLRFARAFYKRGKVVQSLVNTPYSEERKKDSELTWHKFMLAKNFDKWSARLSPNIFYHSITKEVLQHYKPLYKIGDNYEIIYRGRYENKFQRNEKLKKEFTIINVGRQEFAKGQLDIVKALNFIKEKYNKTDIKFQLLGRPGHYSAKIEKFIQDNNLGNQVEIHGFVNDVEKRLVQADAFIFPSYYEGLGGALIEASAAKLPVVCSNIPVLKEVVGSEDGALFCAPGDYETLGENIYKLYQDEELRKRLGEYSYQNFQRRFKLEKVNNEMLEMYNNLLEAK